MHMENIYQIIETVNLIKTGNLITTTALLFTVKCFYISIACA
jgi:hypothetical protein